MGSLTAGANSAPASSQKPSLPARLFAGHANSSALRIVVPVRPAQMQERLVWIGALLSQIAHDLNVQAHHSPSFLFAIGAQLFNFTQQLCSWFEPLPTDMVFEEFQVVELLTLLPTPCDRE